MTSFFCAAADKLELTDYWLTPFLRPTNAVPRRKILTARILPFIRGGKPVVVQLLGHDPDVMAKMAAAVAALDGVIGVNLNFACPSKPVVGSGGGAALLREPELAAEMIRAIRRISPELSLSVKIRCGFDSPAETEGFLTTLPLDELDFVIAHFRTAREGYRKVDGGIRRLRMVVDAVAGLPVFGSGDLFSPAAAREMTESAACAGVAPARGFIADPYLLRRVKGESGLPDTETARRRFLLTLLNVSADSPNRRGRRSSILELAGMGWGTNHPFFERLKTATTDNDLENAVRGLRGG